MKFNKSDLAKEISTRTNIPLPYVNLFLRVIPQIVEEVLARGEVFAWHDFLQLSTYTSKPRRVKPLGSNEFRYTKPTLSIKCKISPKFKERLRTFNEPPQIFLDDDKHEEI